MSILPFDCRAYAVKPRSAYSKTRMESRASLGGHKPGTQRPFARSLPHLGSVVEPHRDHL
eukprot:3306939-Pleurochrysis_carterae.AAC.1